jgi:hypothetical protein
MRDCVCQIGFLRSYQITVRVTAAPTDGSSSAIDAISLWFVHRRAKGASSNWFVSEVLAILGLTLEYCIGIKIWRVCVKFYHKNIKRPHMHKEEKYRVSINYRRISLRHNLSRKCRKFVKFLSITHSERNIWTGPIVATAISREKRKPVLEGNGCLTDRT